MYLKGLKWNRNCGVMLSLSACLAACRCPISAVVQPAYTLIAILLRLECIVILSPCRPDIREKTSLFPGDKKRGATPNKQAMEWARVNECRWAEHVLVPLLLMAGRLHRQPSDEMVSDTHMAHSAKLTTLLYLNSHEPGLYAEIPTRLLSSLLHFYTKRSSITTSSSAKQ